MAPARIASEASDEPTALGSTRPGFCGSSSWFFTCSHPARAKVQIAPATSANRARFICLFISDRPRFGLVLQVETEGEVGRRRAAVEIVADFRQRAVARRRATDAVVLFRIHAGVARPRVDVANADDEVRPALRADETIHALRKLDGA